MLTFTIEKPKEISFGIQNVDLGADAYDRGYEEGEKEGYTNGYEIGAKEGAEVGYAKGEQEGYTKGYDKGTHDGEQNALDAVNYELAGRGLEEVASVDEIPHKLDDAFIALESNGYESGKQAEYDAFWDAYQENGKRTNYDRAFAGIGWTKDTFKPKYLPIRPTAGNMYMCFAYSNVGKIDESIVDASQMKSLSMAFYQCTQPLDKHTNVTDITIDISSLTSMGDTFNYNAALETLVLKNVPETCNFTGGFSGCNRLTNFTVTGTIGGTAFNLSSCSMLTDASVQCIIDHLKDRTGTTAATLTFHKTVGGKLTQAKKDAISAKNWTLVY